MKKIIETEDGALFIENGIKEMIDGVFIHWEIYRWTPSKVKYYKDLWNNYIVHKLLIKYASIYAIPPTEKEEKLIKMFGFDDTGIRLQGNMLLKYTEKPPKGL